MRGALENADADPAALEEEMGDLLFAIANLSRKLGVEPENALRARQRQVRGTVHGAGTALDGARRADEDRRPGRARGGVAGAEAGPVADQARAPGCALNALRHALWQLRGQLGLPETRTRSESGPCYRTDADSNLRPADQRCVAPAMLERRHCVLRAAGRTNGVTLTVRPSVSIVIAPCWSVR